jgi:hypothetical protein
MNLITLGFVFKIRISSVPLRTVGAKRTRFKTFEPLTFQYFPFTDPLLAHGLHVTYMNGIFMTL